MMTKRRLRNVFGRLGVHTTSSTRMARRKTWPESVAEKRGLGVAGKRGRKAWLKVVPRRASRIEDVGHSVGLPE